MKQYLTKQQTEELIKLGLPVPDRAELKDWEDPIEEVEHHPAVFDDDGWPELYKPYDIGELIEMLPKTINNINGSNNLNIFFARNYWHIVYLNHHTNHDLRRVSGQELTDALYRMTVLLKQDCIL